MKELNLREKYHKEVVPKLKEIFGYKNNLMAPKLEKISINVGVGRASQNPNFQDKILPEIIKELALITGQKPKTTTAKKSISGFKTRQGQIIGLKITLRRDRMYEFLERLIKMVLPRVRDFRGLNPKSVDSKGNLSIGFKEHAVFPEIKPEFSKADFGLEASIITSAKNKNEALELYKLLGIPFKKA